MYAIERVRIIRKYLKEHGKVQVNTLSDLLGVSEVTVRRDLEKLEEDGRLTRTHGGAVMNDAEPADPLFEALEEPEDDGKRDEIAALALKMVNDGDVIMLTSGAANVRLAGRLESRRDLTVLTNDLSAALRISLQPSNRVVLLGGDLDKDEKALFGSMAVDNLRKFFVEKLFIEVDGINEYLQLTVTSREKADLILGALGLAASAVVVCPSDRFDRSAFYRLGDVSLATGGLISNTCLSECFKSKIFDANVPLYTSIAAFEGTQ